MIFIPHTANTPAPDDYNAFINKSASDSVYFSIQWDSAFSNMHRIETYTLEVSDGFIECPLTCLPSDEGPCQCSGLTTGSDGNITITATSCGNLQGPPTVIYVKPRGKFLAYTFSLISALMHNYASPLI